MTLAMHRQGRLGGVLVAALLVGLVLPSGVAAATAPTITSANNATFIVGTAGSFTVTTTGDPVAAVSYTGSLPSNVTFTPNADGTATIAGTPATGTQGVYSIIITAANGTLPNATQNFTLTVKAITAPAITSASDATFTVGVAGSFTVTTTGYPVATLSQTGAPAWVTFTNVGDGTATITGTPTAAGSPSFTITAANGTLPNATQTFTLTVVAASAPAITSANSTTFVVGTAGSFTVTTTGAPKPGLSVTGGLPGGVTFTDNGNGTATLGGTAATGSAGIYALIITASNGVGSNATQNFTLNVVTGIAPAFTSVAATTFTIGTAGSFQVTTTGSPPATITRTGTLPNGVSFTANPANGTATFSGTPASNTAGTYVQTLTASNGRPPNATQTFTLTVSTGGPTVTINQASGQLDPTNVSPIRFTVVFSASVTGFGAQTSDVTISGTAGGTKAAAVSGSGTTYTVSISGMTTPGTVIATIPAGAATDTSGRANLASTSTDNTVGWATSAASLTVTPSASTITWGQTVTLLVRIAANGANRQVQLWGARDNRNPANFALITTLTTNSSGVAALAYTPPTNLYYEARFLGAADLAAAISPQSRVVVRQISLLRPTNGGAVKSVSRGTKVNFTTTVRPSRPELTPATVTYWVFRKVSGAWQQYYTTNVVADSAGLARFSWTFSSSGTWYVRSMANPTPYNANSVKAPIEQYRVS